MFAQNLFYKEPHSNRSRFLKFFGLFGLPKKLGAAAVITVGTVGIHITLYILLTYENMNIIIRSFR